VSLKGSDNPLQIELHISRLYFRLVVYSHLLTIMPVAYLAWDEPLYLLSLPLIFISLRRVLRDYQAYSGWRHLRLFSDGRVDRLEEGGGRVRYQLLHAPFIMPWIIILPLGFGHRRRWLPLLPDALGREQWRALRLFLRYGLE
jgi:hypothetical protein